MIKDLVSRTDKEALNGLLDFANKFLMVREKPIPRVLLGISGYLIATGISRSSSI